MSTEETPAPPTVPRADAPETWGTPLPPGAGKVEVPTQVEMRPHWPARKVIGAVALAVIIVGGGTAVAIAATQPDPANVTHPNTGVSGGQATGGSSGRHTGGYSGGPLANAVHGDFVARTSTGGYATERFQVGRVTTVGSNSLTLTSQDHYVGHYLITSATVLNHGAITLSDVKAGDAVTVIAMLSGETASATTISDYSDQQTPATHSGDSSGGMQPNDTTPTGPGN